MSRVFFVLGCGVLLWVGLPTWAQAVAPPAPPAGRPAAEVDTATDSDADADATSRTLEIEGTLEPDALFDLHEIELKAGQQLIVNLRSRDFDTFVSVRSPSGAHTANDDWNQASGHSHIHLQADEPGKWQVRVAGFDIDATGDYRLELFVGDQSPDGSLPPIIKRGELEEGDEEIVGAPGRYIDRFSFEVEAGQHATIDLNSDLFDTFLKLDNQAGESWENDDYNNSSGHSRLAMTLTQPGTYTASVTSFDPKETGTYQLLIRRGPPPPEPLQVDRNVHNDALAKGDRALDDGELADTYTLQGEAGDQVTITMESLAFDTYLIFVQEDVEEGLVFENDDAREDDPTRSQIIQTLPADGTYTVYATSYESGETGAYKLTIEHVGSQSGDKQPGELTKDDLKTEDGKLIDWLPVPIEAGQYIEVILESQAFDPQLILETPTGERWFNDDDRGSSSRSRIELDADRPGIYRVGVTTFEASESGAYTLDFRIKPGEDPAGMRLSQKIAGGEQAEGRLMYGDTVLGGGSFADRHHFDAEVGQQVILDVTSQQFDTYLRLQGPDGSIIENDDFDGPGHSQIELEIEQAGRYRVVVTTYQPDQTGRYKLAMKLRKGPKEAAPERKIIGLFVGISDYNGLGDLPFTADDAERLHRQYREKAGMRAEDATLLLDQKATVENIEKALKKIAKTASASDTVVIFYSGHGSQYLREDGFNAADPDAKDETLTVVDGEITDDRFAELLKPCNAGTVMVVIDACFSGGFAKEVVSRPGRIGLFSSEEDVLSLVADKFKAGGYLSKFLLEAMGEKRDEADLNHDKAITAHELSHYLSKRFAEELRQSKPARDFIEGTEVDPSVHLGFQKLVVDRGGVSPHHVLLAWD